MTNKPIYNLSKDIEWGKTVWVLYTANSSPFGRYSTKAAALADARVYGLKVQVTEFPRKFNSFAY